MDISKLSAVALGRLIADREISSEEAVQSSLARISRHDFKIGAFLTVAAEHALAQARKADRLIADGRLQGRLAGVPMAVKDNISTKQIRTTCGSRMLAEYVPVYDATVVDRLQTSGAVMIGKTNLDEFAMGSTTETSWFQTTSNPWNLKHVPGGSSGGSAAAVASAEVFFAIGSDTGGSIRQPCGYCNLTGLKPTYGTVSRYGLIAYASSLDQIGPIARDAVDCAEVYLAITGEDAKDSSCIPARLRKNTDGLLELSDKLTELTSGRSSEQFSVKNKKIAVPASYLEHGVQADVRKALEQAIVRLGQLGAQCEYVDVPLVDEGISAYYLIACAEASSNLARYDGVQYGYRGHSGQRADLEDFYLTNRTEGFGNEVRQRILLGTFALSSGYYDDWYLKAQKIRALIKAAYGELLQRFDMILSPVAPDTAPLKNASLNDPLSMYLNDVFTVSANLTGLPALALPCGFSDAGLPIGMQLTGGYFSEDMLLSTGICWQQNTNYHQQQPEMGGEYQ